MEEINCGLIYAYVYTNIILITMKFIVARLKLTITYAQEFLLTLFHSSLYPFSIRFIPFTDSRTLYFLANK